MRDVLWCVRAASVAVCLLSCARVSMESTHPKDMDGWMDGRADGLDGWVEVAGFIVESFSGFFIHCLRRWSKETVLREAFLRLSRPYEGKEPSLSGTSD